MDKFKQVYLDANAVLRYVLHDIDDQYDIVLKSVRTEYCVAPLEVMTEVAFVLEGVYGVPREEMVTNPVTTRHRRPPNLLSMRV